MAEEVTELYALDPSDFVAARDALARRLRSEKRRDEATQVAALRRPPKSAWALNRLAREQPDRVEEVLGSASALADALETGEDLRGAQQAYRDAIHAAVEQAAADAGIDSEQMRSRMRDTLFAAGASAEVAAMLRTGTLADDEPAPGFGVGPAKHGESGSTPAGRRAPAAKAPRRSGANGRQADEAAPVDELAERRAARRRELEERVRALQDELRDREATAAELREGATAAEEEAEAARRRAEGAAQAAEAAAREADAADAEEARVREELEAARRQLDEHGLAED